MFELRTSDLNNEQIEAIESENNILLIACPGSGKTRTLTYKIAYELSKIESKKQYIIAITYTNRAADEIKERIEVLGIETKQLWIGTLHSFCLEWILRPYSLYLNELKKGFRVINSHDTEQIITDLCSEYNSSNNLMGNRRVLYWDFILSSDSTPSYMVTTNSTNKQRAVNEIFNLYLGILNENNQIDFEQILYYSYKLLLEQTEISRILSKIFSYLLVDEFQDTKELQYKILGKILYASNKESSLFIVGDPNQSIYGSLGGYAISKNDLESLTNLEIEEKSLSKNYRSSNCLVEYFDEYKTYTNEIRACGINRDYESIITFNDFLHRDSLIDEIVRLINYNINYRGISENEIAILGPWWIHLLSLTRSLSSLLPQYSFDGPGLVPFSRDHENFFYMLSKIALTEASPNMYLKRMRWAKEILKEFENNDVVISNYNPKKLLRVSNSIDISEENGVTYLRYFFEELFSILGVDINSNLYLEEHYNAFFESTEQRLIRLRNEGVENATNIDLFRKVFKEKSGITISSIHGVKGAEFDTVIAFGLLEDIVPHFSDNNGDDSAKKILYVLSSRARKNLHLISEQGRRQSYTTNVLREYNYEYSIL